MRVVRSDHAFDQTADVAKQVAGVLGCDACPGDGDRGRIREQISSLVLPSLLH
jgi:hypothetical protein